MIWVALHENMGSHIMKTTIEIADDLFERAQRVARKEKTTFRSLTEQGLRLVLKDLAGAERQLDVMAHAETIVGSGRGGTQDIWDMIRELEDQAYRTRAQVFRSGGGIAILKLPIFQFSDKEVGELIDKVRGAHSLVLDLRGNPGGRLRTLTARTSSPGLRPFASASVPGRTCVIRQRSPTISQRQP